MGAHRLDSNEGIPLARGPRAFAEPIDRRVVAEPPEGDNERDRIEPRERPEGQRREPAFALEIVERLPEGWSVGDLVVAGGRHDDDRPITEPQADEGQQARTHLVHPVQIFEDDEQRPTPGQIAEELCDALEDQARVCRRSSRRRTSTDLGQQPRQLRAQRRTEASEQLGVGGDVSRTQGIDPRSERKNLL